MTPLSINKNITIVNADCLEYMRTMEENSVDAIITDPPAGISFMGKEWDIHSNLIAFQNFICQAFIEVIRILKPGGHALVWAIPRTSHHTAMGLERAGFEIRDVITHIFGSGFPKSLNIGKAVDKMQGKKVENKSSFSGVSETRDNTKNIMRYKKCNECGKLLFSPDPCKCEWRFKKSENDFEGLGTALKPAVEFWWLARKPLSEPTIAQNCLKWGTGGLSIDECRVGTEELDNPIYDKSPTPFSELGQNKWGGNKNKVVGRFPANLILTCLCDEVREGKEFVSGSFPEERGETAFFGLNKKHSHRVGQVKDKAIIHTNPECPCYMLDRQSGKLNKQGISKSDNKSGWQDSFIGGKIKSPVERELYLDIGGASRFFYQAKASRSERNAGCEGLEEKKLDESRKEGNPGGDNPRNRGVNPQTNFHPTVKPIALMEYLIKLISRKGQIVLDPFLGSGSTLIACENLGRKGIGIEKDKEYFKIAHARLKNLPAKLF